MSRDPDIKGHAFVAGDGALADWCRAEPYGSLCGYHWSRHAEGSQHVSGASPLRDGPVRSTVERQQERIQSLEYQVANYAEDRDALIDQRQKLTDQVRDLEVKVVTLEAENLYLRGQRQILEDSERALSTRLNHLDSLAREVSERVTRLMAKLDNK